MQGILIVDKPMDWTSFDVVANWMTAVMSGHSVKIFSTSSCLVMSAL